MLLDVVVAACAAFAASGVIYAGFRLFRSKPPKWLIPTVAAVAVVGVTAYQRYDWHNRVIALLPPEMVVVETLTTRVWVEPWSLVQPVVSSVVVVDRGSLRRNPDHPGLALVDLIMMSRDDDTAVIRHLVDCPRSRLAPLPADTTFSGDGLPDTLDWRTGAPDVLFAAACETGS